MPPFKSVSFCGMLHSYNVVEQCWKYQTFLAFQRWRVWCCHRRYSRSASKEWYAFKHFVKSCVVKPTTVDMTQPIRDSLVHTCVLKIWQWHEYLFADSHSDVSMNKNMADLMAQLQVLRTENSELRQAVQEKTQEVISIGSLWSKTCVDVHCLWRHRSHMHDLVGFASDGCTA